MGIGWLPRLEKWNFKSAEWGLMSQHDFGLESQRFLFFRAKKGSFGVRVPEFICSDKFIRLESSFGFGVHIANVANFRDWYQFYDHQVLCMKFWYLYFAIYKNEGNLLMFSWPPFSKLSKKISDFLYIFFIYWLLDL